MPYSEKKPKQYNGFEMFNKVFPVVDILIEKQVFKIPKVKP